MKIEKRDKTESTALGLFKTQSISKKIPGGYQIDVPEGAAFLPEKETEKELQPGDIIEVFIYHDYDGHLTASVQKPLIQAGECGVLEIKASGNMGAFADWGLAKDLFIPHAEQLEPLEPGQRAAVFAYVDEKSGRITGSTRMDRHFPDTIEEGELKTGTQYKLIIFHKTDMGYKALVDGRVTGILYENELTQPVSTGMELDGYIKKIREDGKADLTLRKTGYNEVLDAVETLQRLLEENDGFLPWHDKSEPALIRAALGMSKRTFKSAAGALLKQNRITMEEKGTRLR